MGLFLGWRYKLLCMHVYKDLIRCKSVCDIKQGIDPCPLLARSCDRWWLDFVSFTTWIKSKLSLKRHSAFRTGTKIYLSEKIFWGYVQLKWCSRALFRTRRQLNRTPIRGYFLPQKPTSTNSNSTRIEDSHENQLRLLWLPLLTL